MANTYFEMKVEKKTLMPSSPEVSLTAFCGNTKSIQLTLRPMLKPDNTGFNYILLTDEEALRLSKALLERIKRRVTATGCEKSFYTDKEEEDDDK